MIRNIINVIYCSLSTALMVLVLCKNYNFAYIVSIGLLVSLLVAVGYAIAEFDSGNKKKKGGKNGERTKSDTV